MTKRIMMDIRGRLRIKDQTGEDVDIVVQLVAAGLGNGRMTGKRQYQVRRHCQHPMQPNSPEQLAWKDKFSAATAAWKALTEEERAVWRREAKPKKRTGWNLFISRYLSA